MMKKIIIPLIVSVFSLLAVPAFAQKVACANDFTGCSHGVIALPAGASPANPTATASDTPVNGVATTFMASDSAPAVQKATSSQFGIVKVDGTSIVATGGVISANGTVTAGGNNTFTGNNTFQTGTLLFRADPTISSGGSATDGAVFFGTNLGSRYLSYDATTGGTGGYSLGSTYGASDTLYVGPIVLRNASGALTLHAASTGIYSFTFPTSSGSSGQVLTTNGTGGSSWTAAGSGTVTSVTCGTNMTGGTITSSGTCNVPTATTSTTGATTLATSSCGSSSTTVVTPASAAATTSASGIAGCIGTLQIRAGAGTSDVSGNFTVTFVVPFSTGCAGYSAGGTNLDVVVFSSCTTTSISGKTLAIGGAGAQPFQPFGYVAVGN